MAKDALGNSIQIGQTYGYTQNKNGITKIVIGVADSISEFNVTLKDIQEKTALWGNDINPFSAATRKRSVGSLILFPINQTQNS